MIARIFLWSWIVTLPVTLVGGYWLFATLERFHTYAVRYTGTEAGDAEGMNLPTIGRYELNIMWQRVRAEISRLAGNESRLKPIRLFVPESNIRQLESHMPQSGFQYVRGGMFVDGRLINIRYRYRGDSVYRWAWHKKSIRVKTGKKNLYEGIRTFNLLAARSDEQLNNYLSYELAGMMGLIAPKTELVRVYLNGEDQGVHFLVEQMEEISLRNRNLMPGDLYRGEMIGKDQFVGSDVGYLFDTLTGWDKVAVNNHFEEDSLAPLQRLLDLLEQPDDPESHKQLGKLLDLNAWATYNVYESLAQSSHADDSHNWRLYYDPWRQKFIPVIWDTMGWYSSIRLDSSQPLMIPNTLMGTLFKNGDFLRARAVALRKVYDDGIDTRFGKLVEETVATMVHENKTDPYLRPADPDQVHQAMQVLVQHIKQSFNLLDYRNHSPARVDYHYSDNKLKLRLHGSMPIDQLTLEFDRLIPRSTTVVAKVKNQAKEPMTVDVAIAGNKAVFNLGMLPDFSVSPLASSRANRRAFSHDVGPATTMLEFSNLGAGTQLRAINAFNNNQPINSREVADIELTAYRTLQLPVKENPWRMTTRWSGETVIENDMTIHGELHIAPGTTIRLAPDASVIVYGKVLANGNSAAPIRFLPLHPDQGPWGTFSLQGRGTDGSRLSHCEFSGGSGEIDHLFEFSSLFSVHDAQDVIISNCVFRDNFAVDDMVHVVYSDIIFDTSKFENSLSDALDLDISRATIINSEFNSSGNDGIDLMTTRATIINTTITNNGDKGISVGEGSRLVSINNHLLGNHIGVQSKDASIAVLVNNTLENNQTALHTYRKNWQYGTGGKIYATKSVISSGQQPAVAADKGSEISLFDNYVSEESVGKRVSSLANDSRDATKASQQPLLDPSAKSNEVGKMIESLTTYQHSLMDSSRRGVSSDG